MFWAANSIDFANVHFVAVARHAINDLAVEKVVKQIFVVQLSLGRFDFSFTAEGFANPFQTEVLLQIHHFDHVVVLGIVLCLHHSTDMIFPEDSLRRFGKRGSTS